MTRLSRLALCVPAHNAASHLPRLLDSVRRQTSAFDEVLVYDDASTDATGDLARDFGATVVRTDTNTGPSIGKNVLAGRASADWVHFHDADDALQPEFVARARRWLERDDLEVLVVGTEDRDDSTGRTLLERRWDAAAIARDAVGYCILNTITNCGVYKRTAFLSAGGFDSREETKYNEDQAMHLRLAMNGLRFRADDYIGVVIYRRGGSMSSGHPIECARAHYHVLAGVAERTGGRYSQELGQELWRHAGVCGTYLDWDYARRCLTLARSLGYVDPAREDRIFRMLARIHPFAAVAIREYFVRWFKSDLRVASPRVS